MAEGWSSSVLCRYYLNGCCRDGASCRFSHDRQNSQPSMVCRFYSKGHCSYGDRCRYDHIRLQPNVANNVASTTSNNHTNKSTTSPVIPETSNSTLNRNSTRTNVNDLGNMTILRKSNCISKANTSPNDFLSLCAEAPEFVPVGPVTVKSYAEVIGEPENKENSEQQTDMKQGDDLCPFAMMGECRYGDQCAYIHGDICEQCGQACLHPTNVEQRRQHKTDCLNALEQDMEHSFAIARSKDKTCTICMDVIMEKWPQHERRFGLLPNCNHVFCLSCIRKWRGTKQLENKTVRSCPECRTPSDFVTPSNYWCDSQVEKDKLIDSYKKALSLKPCKYFKQGNGECPFAGNCFYLHAYPDGRKAEMPPPKPRRRRNAEGDLEVTQRFLLWDFMDERESSYWLHFEWDESGEYLSDSDDSSDFSDFDM